MFPGSHAVAIPDKPAVVMARNGAHLTRRRSAVDWGSCSLVAICRISKSRDRWPWMIRLSNGKLWLGEMVDA